MERGRVHGRYDKNGSSLNNQQYGLLVSGGPPGTMKLPRRKPRWPLSILRGRPLHTHYGLGRDQPPRKGFVESRVLVYAALKWYLRELIEASCKHFKTPHSTAPLSRSENLTRPRGIRLSQICHGAVETARNWAGAVGTVMRRKLYAIGLFSTARDRPGPLAESSHPVWLERVALTQRLPTTGRAKVVGSTTLPVPRRWAAPPAKLSTAFERHEER